MSSNQKQNQKIQEKKEFNWNNNTQSTFFNPKKLKSAPSIQLQSQSCRPFPAFGKKIIQ